MCVFFTYEKRNENREAFDSYQRTSKNIYTNVCETHTQRVPSLRRAFDSFSVFFLYSLIVAVD